MIQEIYEQPSVIERLHQKLNKQRELQDLFVNKRNIYLIGTGASYNACCAAELIFIKEQRRKPSVIAANDIDYYLPLISLDDLLIVVSQSGESLEICNLTRKLNNSNIPYVAITNNQNSTLALGATILIYLDANEEVSSATKTYTASIFILLFLASQDKNSEVLKNCVTSLNSIISSIGSYADVINFLKPLQRMYVLSDYVNYSTARATALLLKEKNRILAEAMTLSEFRHGAVEVVTENFACLMIVSNHSEIDNIHKHLEFLNTIGASVIIISSYDIPLPRTMKGIKVPAFTPVEFAPLFMIIIPQLISALLAKELGLDMDGFLHLSKIVDQY